MNKLSTALLLIDILSSVQEFLAMTAITTLFGLIVTLFARFVEGVNVPKKVFIILGIVLPLSALAAVAIPSKQTLNMIVASELGEDAINNPQVKEILTLGVKKIKKELAE